MKCLHMPHAMPLLQLSLSLTCSSKLAPLSFSSSSSSSSSSRTPFHPFSAHVLLRPVRCRAASPGPPPPPRIDPPPDKLQDLAATLSKVQDRVQIFFAVLFWMSLFFWASAWDGRNRLDKGSRFRR